MANPLDRSVPHHHMAPGNAPHFMPTDGHGMAGMQGLGQMPQQPTEYSFVMPRDAPQHTPLSPNNSRKRRASDVDPEPGQQMPMQPMSQSSSAMHYAAGPDVFHTMQQQQQQQQQQQPQQQHQPPPPGVGVGNADPNAPPAPPLVKKSRTNTPWTPGEEHRLKLMRDAGNSWSEIAKTFPNRTEGSVKKHWYKDMHYAEFAEDESAALLAAIKEYENSKWKVIGAKLGKPAKACEQYAKEHFSAKT